MRSKKEWCFRCVLATLTTNAEVFIFESPKDAQKGEWEEVKFSFLPRSVEKSVS